MPTECHKIHQKRFFVDELLVYCLDRIIIGICHIAWDIQTIIDCLEIISHIRMCLTPVIIIEVKVVVCFACVAFLIQCIAKCIRLICIC